MTGSRTLVYWLLGVLFGLTLSRSGAADYNYIQRMFLFTDPQLFLIMGTAVVIGIPAMWIVKRHGRTPAGEILSFAPRPMQRGQLVGSVCFGIGWSIAGMCPGPIWVNIGEGKIYALAAMAGALGGATLFGWLAPRFGR
jgi:uncharacterized protein